jgi:hypothetical protein
MALYVSPRARTRAVTIDPRAVYIIGAGVVLLAFIWIYLAVRVTAYLPQTKDTPPK